MVRTDTTKRLVAVGLGLILALASAESLHVNFRRAS